MKKSICVVLSIFILFYLTGCKSNNNQNNNSNPSSNENNNSNNKTSKIEIISLPFDLKDTLNPYTSKTNTNLNLMPLIFDGLVSLSDKYITENIIAHDINISNVTVTVNLKTNIKFSDGSILSSKDVKYSYDELIKNNSYYAQRFSNVANLKVNGQNQIIFTLNKPDKFFTNNLDFPIIKYNTVNQDLPIGCGKYYVEKNELSYSLKINSNYHKNIETKFTSIPLNSFPDYQSMILGIKTNQISALFTDLSQGEISTTNTLTKNVPLNNMLYLGFNGENGLLSQKQVRQAISYGIDKQTILSKAFSSRGTVANIPCNPNFNIDNNLTIENMITYNLEKSNKMLDDAGFTKKDDEGFRVDNSNNRIIVNILVNKDNIRKKNMANIIKDMLKVIGLDSSLKEVAYQEYLENINKKSFDIYIGEVKLLNNMDISGFFNGSVYSSGITNQQPLLDKYNNFIAGNADYLSFLKDFNGETPFLPVGFISGLLIYNKNIQSEVIPTPTNIYDNITSWY